MTRYISKMSQNIIDIIKRCGKTWSEIWLKLQNKYSTTVSKRGMQNIWQKFIKIKETKDLALNGKPEGYQ